MMTGRYCPFPRQELKPNESKVCDTRVSLGQGMKPGYTGYIPGNLFSRKTMCELGLALHIPMWLLRIGKYVIFSYPRKN